MISIFNKNKSKINKLKKIVSKINNEEGFFEKLSDKEILDFSNSLRGRAKQEGLDNILVEAYALVREAAKRALGLRAFDVQLMSAIILHEGAIPEMKTGEGKTLSSVFPAYLNSLSGKGVHIVTVNDYLTHRDFSEMKPVFDMLGVSTGLLNSGVEIEDRVEVYKNDIVYGTNSDFGFDFIRDNMAESPDMIMQRGHNYAIIDEVDSILIDEARTPLIISGESDEGEFLYGALNDIAKLLFSSDNIEGDGDYFINKKQKTVTLLKGGFEKIEKEFLDRGIIDSKESLYSADNVSKIHMLEQALKANSLFTENVDYVVKDGEVVIVDEFTGRLQDGRRWGGGLHQAVEAKEGLEVKKETKMLGSITLQNYFKMYSKISGMTGTAKTEEKEFEVIYGLRVWQVPTNLEIRRVDNQDSVFLTKAGKYKNLVNVVKERTTRGQPILIGVPSVDVSEEVSFVLNSNGIKHDVLNAKNHFREAEIIENSGKRFSVTVATNMAGRGTDIQLGGNRNRFIEDMLEAGLSKEEALEYYKKENAAVKELGGLLVIGVERNEARRIDNQLRGRSGRQGDVGESMFYLSLDDTLMRVFSSDKIEGVWRSLGVTDEEPISHSIISASIRNSQKKIEGLNFESRKNLLKFDSVSSRQRDVFYEFRKSVLFEKDIYSVLENFIYSSSEYIVGRNYDDKTDTLDLDLFEADLRVYANLELGVLDVKISSEGKVSKSALERDIYLKIIDNFNKSKEDFSEIIDFESLVRTLILRTSDKVWSSHLSGMENLRKNISLSSYAQRNPLNEYKQEGIRLFKNFFTILKINSISELMHYSYADTIINSLNDAPILDLSSPKKLETVLNSSLRTSDLKYRRRRFV